MKLILIFAALLLLVVSASLAKAEDATLQLYKCYSSITIPMYDSGSEEIIRDLYLYYHVERTSGEILDDSKGPVGVHVFLFSDTRYAKPSQSSMDSELSELAKAQMDRLHDKGLGWAIQAHALGCSPVPLETLH